MAARVRARCAAANGEKSRCDLRAKNNGATVLRTRIRFAAGALLACTLMNASGAPAPSPALPFSVQVTVICSNAPMAHDLSLALTGALKKDGYLLHGSPWPMMRIFVYAAQTVNNRKDPNGWSIGVAHAYFEPILAAAGHLMQGNPPAFRPGKTTQLAMMLLHAEGVLTYLNVMNLDHLDPRMLRLLAGNIVNSFSKRWPPLGPGGPRPKALPQLP